MLIAGPTASGKSALALALAERLGGVVLNADSMQVYADLRILTARPDPGDEARVPHRLYGHVTADRPYSVGAWLEDVRRVLAEAAAARRVPVFVGGTGLYFRALTAGLAAVPPIPEEIRAHWRARRAEGAALHAELARRDPAMAARLRPTDPQRVLRALEVLDATGRSLADWQAETGPPLVRDAVRMVLETDRAALYARIDARFDAMLRQGALDELIRLRARGLDPSLPALRALGVPSLMAHLDGRMPLDEAVAQAKAESRRYAKRQMTWFRRQMPEWPRIVAGDPDAALASALRLVTEADRVAAPARS